MEAIYNPIMQKVYQAAGGAPGGMPGGFPGQGAPDQGASSGPTVDEVDWEKYCFFVYILIYSLFTHSLY